MSYDRPILIACVCLLVTVPCGGCSSSGGKANSSQTESDVATPGASAGSVVMVTITEHHIMMPTRLQAGQLTFQIMNDTKHERDLQITGDGVDTSLLDPIDAGDNGELIITLHPGPYTATVLDGENGSPGIKLQFTAIP